MSDQSHKVTAFQDLIAGGVAGSVSVIVGHPFDTLKVRLQTSGGGKSSNISSSLAAFGGFSSLFRGMAAPLSTAAMVNAIIFSSFGESSRLWDYYFYPEDGYLKNQEFFLHENGDSPNPSPDDESLDHTSLQKSFICGSFAGFVQSLIICPVEHVKCRLQIQHGKSYSDHIYKGSFDAVDKIMGSHGIRGLYRGYICTSVREIPAFGLYFVCYDYVKHYIDLCISTRQKKDVQSTLEMNAYDERVLDETHSHTWISSILAGGFSGAFTWAAIYPVDVIKTKIQTAPLNSPSEKLGMIHVGRRIVYKQGWRHLFRGLGVTVLRAFPVNGIIFPVYEYTLMQLTSRDVGGAGSINTLGTS